MPYRADLELARLHLSQIEKKIEEQHTRIASLKLNGQQTESAEDLLKVLAQTRNLIADFIRRATPPTSSN